MLRDHHNIPELDKNKLQIVLQQDIEVIKQHLVFNLLI